MGLDLKSDTSDTFVIYLSYLLMLDLSVVQIIMFFLGKSLFFPKKWSNLITMTSLAHKKTIKTTHLDILMVQRR